MRISTDDPYFYGYVAAAALVGLLVYWYIWKKNSRLANLLVFGALIGLMAYLADWDYLLNNYFRVSSWRFPQ
jgi:hypothetical protein